jgi:putative peptidoglycan binding protein/transglycosylase-like protein with SLT domain
MSNRLLRLHDGFDHTSPELCDEVKELQTELNKQGYSLDVDGLFGYDMEDAVKEFQAQHGLDDDGIVGPYTWAALFGTEPPNPDLVFLTTFPSNSISLLRDFSEATKFKAFIDEGEQMFTFQASLIGGVGSRESAWGRTLKPPGPAGTGDFAKRRFPKAHRPGPLPPDGGGFGRGLMQIDFDAHEFARTGNWRDPRANILFGCQVLSEVQRFIGKNSNLAGRSLLRAALSAYNSGVENVLKAIQRGLDVDFFTSGRNYSRDVLNRAGFFQLQGWE